MKENVPDARKEETLEKKPYMKPVLKPYIRPKLRKHKSYKDITRTPATLVAPPPIPS